VAERACDLCGGPGRELYPAGPDRFRHVRCARCGLLFVSPLPPDLAGLNARLYGGPPRPDRAAVGRRDRRFVRAARRRLGPGARLLDVGCGGGELLAAAAALGLEAAGVDASPDRAAEARSRSGRPVHTGELADLPPGAPFDLIRMNQLVEHAPSPTALLRAAAAQLAPGGELHVATPNAASLAHDVLGGGWRQLGRPGNAHLVLLDPATLARATERAGLEVASVATRGARALGGPIRV